MLYQARSLSKFIAAIGTMRLVEAGTLKLDGDVNDQLTSWRMPRSDFDATHKVTSCGLLSMTGVIGAPGFLGYEVTVNRNSWQRLSLFRRGCEIAEAMVQDVTGKPFPQLMQDLALGPMGMTDSSFDLPPSAAVASKAVSGHFSDGKEPPGRWHIFPKPAAARLWSTPTDLANLLVQLADTWQRLTSIFSPPPDSARDADATEWQVLRAWRRGCGR